MHSLPRGYRVAVRHHDPHEEGDSASFQLLRGFLNASLLSHFLTSWSNRLCDYVFSGDVPKMSFVKLAIGHCMIRLLPFLLSLSSNLMSGSAEHRFHCQQASMLSISFRKEHLYGVLRSSLGATHVLRSFLSESPGNFLPKTFSCVAVFTDNTC